MYLYTYGWTDLRVKSHFTHAVSIHDAFLACEKVTANRFPINTTNQPTNLPTHPTWQAANPVSWVSGKMHLYFFRSRFSSCLQPLGDLPQILLNHITLLP